MANYPAFNDAKPSIETLYNIIRGNEPPDVRTAVLHGWVVQGFLQGALFAPKDSGGAQVKATFMASSVSGKISAPQRMTAAQASNMLGALLQGHSRKDNKETGGLRAQGFLGDLVGKDMQAEIAKLLLPVITNWIVSWLNGGKVATA